MTLSAEDRTLMEPTVVDLLDDLARDPALAGSKAAHLARAARAGLPVLPGFVVTITACDEADGDVELLLHGPAGTAVQAARAALAAGADALVVRSSSAVEDTDAHSMAGVFRSVVDVQGDDEFRTAMKAVLSSAELAPSDAATGLVRAPMAVLVQHHLDSALGGVLFGADPVSGRTDRLVVVVAEGGPHGLVAGTEDGDQEVLSRRGRRLSSTAPRPLLDHRQRRQLARLAAAVADLFGGPQDVEWAFDHDGHLWLLQSRPITALAATRRAKGPAFGPGPVAETFPDPLAPLEVDLWVEPVVEALRTALPLAGAASARAVGRSPVVTTVGGRVAADLGLFGLGPRRNRWLSLLDPRPSARRLLAAWRVGRLRATLPALADDLVTRTDRDLAVVPPVEELTDGELLAILGTTRQALVALHGHEVLVGLLVAPGTEAPTGAGTALRALAEARADGLDDDTIVELHPVVLALVPPAVRGALRLPAAPAPHELDLPTSAPDELALLREALRLRARWVQELGARAAWEIGRRLARAGVLPAPGYVRLARGHEVEEMLRRRRAPEGLAERGEGAGPPLPSAFRLTTSGAVVPLHADGPGTPGRGAGGGRGEGVVHGGDELPEPGAVLVVRTLDPGLAPLLPRLGGLVAETGSVLSHLAILARELGVPTVVGVADAVTRFPAGTHVVVDGMAGDVIAVPESEAA